MQTLIFDRSDLDQVVAIVPGTPPKQITRREDLETSRVMTRSDVVMVNGNRKQYLLYVTERGYSGDMWILDTLEPKELAEVRGIAKRMRQNAIDFPPARKLLV